MNQRKEVKRKSKTRRAQEETGIIVEDDFSEEYIKHSGSISTKQATEYEIGMIEEAKSKGEEDEQGNRPEIQMDIDLGGFTSIIQEENKNEQGNRPERQMDINIDGFTSIIREEDKMDED